MNWESDPKYMEARLVELGAEKQVQYAVQRVIRTLLVSEIGHDTIARTLHALATVSHAVSRRDSLRDITLFERLEAAKREKTSIKEPQ